jgi:hypothetical protein
VGAGGLAGQQQPVTVVSCILGGSVERFFPQHFFFFYGPPQVPRRRRSRGMVRPLRWAPDHQSGDEASYFSQHSKKLAWP